MTWKAEWNNHERFWKQLTGTVTSKASHLQPQSFPPPPRPTTAHKHTLHVFIKDRARHEVRYKVAYKLKSKFADMLITLSSRFFSWLPYLQTKFILHLWHCYQRYWIMTAWKSKINYPITILQEVTDVFNFIISLFLIHLAQYRQATSSQPTCAAQIRKIREISLQ